MRNIKKFASEFGLNLIGDKDYMVLKYNGLCFEIRKGDKGYKVGCLSHRGGYSVTTQLSALWRVTEILRRENAIDDATLKEMRGKISDLSKPFVKANVGKTKKKGGAGDVRY